MRRLVLTPLLLAAAPPAPGPVQQAPAHPATNAACTAPAPLPPGLAAWTDQAPVTAGIRPGEGATIMVGRAALVSLHPAQHLGLAPAPAKPAPAGSDGGTLQLSVAEPGTYRIALGAAAWVDIVADGKALPSSAHSHGPKCSAVRKLVDYKLEAGTYAIQLSGSPAETIALLVTKA